MPGLAEAFVDLAESLTKLVEIVWLSGKAICALSCDVAAYCESFGDKADARLSADLRKVCGLAG